MNRNARLASSRAFLSLWDYERRQTLPGNGGYQSMAYIRKISEELTGYQERTPFSPAIDLRCDFVMVYGTDETMPERIRQFADAGYAVHLMTGISWGDYQDYLDGKWDGQTHWDEAQTERSGDQVLHNPRVPYMVPTATFAAYLTERLKIAVDCGVLAIHLEEPEFWDRSGYSPAFQRAYEERYQEPFVPQHKSFDAHWRCARLKAELYARTLAQISAALKAYAKEKYGRELRFYVPTHSLLNYTQWKIMSPEASLIGIHTVDGYIAQVWTGTSRVANVYEGVYKERTFETAFLEYGVMQELIRGTGRRMWFLNDPIEDNPTYTWENYRYNYQKTAIASLLHPQVWHYEICPWPHRVFEGRYPRISEKGADSFASADAKSIPDAYRTFLSGMFQLFGDMEQHDWSYEGIQEPVGLFLSDTCLFQRTFPDGVPVSGQEEALYSLIVKNSEIASKEETEEKAARSRAWMERLDDDEAGMNALIASSAFPHFFGLALPLLKYGLPIHPVQLDNVRLFPDYLREFRFAILSYEFMKPLDPSIHHILASWVREGGRLICVGDGSDPFHAVRSWWREAGYVHPMQHLFDTLGLPREPADGVFPVGKGSATVWNRMPASICLRKAEADRWRDIMKNTLREGGIDWVYSNHLTLHRGPYVISQVMEESVYQTPKEFEGCFVDLMADGYPIITRKTVRPGESALLYDLDRLEKGRFAVIASAARIVSAEVQDASVCFRAHAADQVLVYIRMRLPFVPASFRASDAGGIPISATWQYDKATQTALICWRSMGKEITVWADASK